MKRSESETWVKDEDAPFCFVCKTDFGYLSRKHHCRRCGNVVCGDCSANQMVLTKLDPVAQQRVCDTCSASPKTPVKLTKAQIAVMKQDSRKAKDAAGSDSTKLDDCSAGPGAPTRGKVSSKGIATEAATTETATTETATTEAATTETATTEDATTEAATEAATTDVATASATRIQESGADTMSDTSNANVVSDREPPVATAASDDDKSSTFSLFFSFFMALPAFAIAFVCMAKCMDMDMSQEPFATSFKMISAIRAHSAYQFITNSGPFVVAHTYVKMLLHLVQSTGVYGYFEAAVTELGNHADLYAGTKVSGKFKWITGFVVAFVSLRYLIANPAPRANQVRRGR